MISNGALILKLIKLYLYAVALLWVSAVRAVGEPSWTLGVPPKGNYRGSFGPDLLGKGVGMTVPRRPAFQSMSSVNNGLWPRGHCQPKREIA
jgi:hypothetical protein